MSDLQDSQDHHPESTNIPDIVNHPPDILLYFHILDPHLLDLFQDLNQDPT